MQTNGRTAPARAFKMFRILLSVEHFLVLGGHVVFELGKARLIIATGTFLNPQNFSPSLPADCGFSKFPCRQLSIRRLNPSLGCATLPVYLAHIYRRFREVKKATLVRGY